MNALRLKQTAAEKNINRHRARILRAAEKLFTKRGFNGTSTREIAVGAGVSLGNIYNHFKTKEEIFVTLLADYEKAYFSPQQPLIKALTETDFPANIETIGRASCEAVGQFSGYILLIYVDVVEFEARHVSGLFSRMQERYLSVVSKRTRNRIVQGVNPAAALMLVTGSFFNYFIMEKLFRGKEQSGIERDEVIKIFSKVFAHGLLSK